MALKKMKLLRLPIINGSAKQDETFTDNRTLFEELYQEWLNTKLCCIAKEMGMNDILYEKVFKSLSEEKRSEFIGRKTDFARTAEIIL